MKKVILGLVAIMLSISFAMANDTEIKEKGALVGQVFINNEGSVAYDAKVELVGAEIKTVTYGNGFFRMSDVPVGRYELKVTLKNNEVIDLGSVEIKKDAPFKVNCFVMY